MSECIYTNISYHMYIADEPYQFHKLKKIIFTICTFTDQGYYRTTNIFPYEQFHKEGTKLTLIFKYILYCFWNISCYKSTIQHLYIVYKFHEWKIWEDSSLIHCHYSKNLKKILLVTQCTIVIIRKHMNFIARYEFYWPDIFRIRTIAHCVTNLSWFCNQLISNVFQHGAREIIRMT